MLKLLLISNNMNPLADFSSALKDDNDVELICANSGETALKMVKDNDIDLVISDEELEDMSGLAFISKLILVNPMLNCVAVSSLSEKDFHEASEGLGVMNHLPVNPGAGDAEELLKNLRRIKGLESG
jgi:DNA-binding NarL/FixJ family response regulator